MSSNGKILEGLWVDELYLLQVIADGIEPLLRGEEGMSDKEARTWALRFAPEGTGSFGNTNSTIEERCLTWVPQLDRPPKKKPTWKSGRSVILAAAERTYAYWDCARCRRRNTDVTFCGKCGKLRIEEPQIKSVSVPYL